MNLLENESLTFCEVYNICKVKQDRKDQPKWRQEGINRNTMHCWKALTHMIYIIAVFKDRLTSSQYWNKWNRATGSKQVTEVRWAAKNDHGKWNKREKQDDQFNFVFTNTNYKSSKHSNKTKTRGCTWPSSSTSQYLLERTKTSHHSHTCRPCSQRQSATAQAWEGPNAQQHSQRADAKLPSHSAALLSHRKGGLRHSSVNGCTGARALQGDKPATHV